VLFCSFLFSFVSSVANALQSEALVQQALDALISTKDSTICLVAHRLSTVKDANKICVLGDGIIQEAGTHDELMENDGPVRDIIMHYAIR
jgi:ABC-type multidrug transport system fused ATPase/permease subunit